MLKRLRTIIALISALLLISSAESRPADPTITAAAVLPRQNKDSFIGYIEGNNTWSSLDCNPGLTWYQSGRYAQCCPETETHCYGATACVGGSQIYTYPDISSVSTIACTENYQDAALSICNTIFIFENTQDSNPRTNINCGDSSVNWSYYRSVPPEATATTSPTPGAISSAPVGPGPTPASDSSSKAWIAGAVVGPILGLALLGAGVWFFLRRHKNVAQLPQQGSAAMAPINPVQPPAGVGGDSEAKPQFHLAQPTDYDRLVQLDRYSQQGFPQQGGFSPAPQYEFQSANHNVKYDGFDGTAELSSGDTGVGGVVPVSELSGVGVNQPGEDTSHTQKPR